MIALRRPIRYCCCFNIHRCRDRALTWFMLKGKLRIFEIIQPPYLSVCERYGGQFRSSLPSVDDAQAEIAAAFDAHKCTPLDSSQNTLRIAC
jgi:hypothetical protein